MSAPYISPLAMIKGRCLAVASVLASKEGELEERKKALEFYKERLPQLEGSIQKFRQQIPTGNAEAQANLEDIIRPWVQERRQTEKKIQDVPREIEAMEAEVARLKEVVCLRLLG